MHVSHPSRTTTGSWTCRLVEAAITPRTKALFLGYPCNPTGAVLSPDDAARPGGHRADATTCWSISDEIYDRLVYGGHRHEPISARSTGMRDRTILLGGFSKAYAMTGWRVGYACAPRDILEGMLKVHQYDIMSAPTTAQDAALVALNGAEQDVRRMVSEYDRRRRMFVDGLNRIGLPTVEPQRRLLRLPLDQAERPHAARSSASACSSSTRWRSSREVPSGRPGRATSAPRWRPATSTSKRR